MGSKRDIDWYWYINSEFIHLSQFQSSCMYPIVVFVFLLVVDGKQKIPCICAMFVNKLEFPSCKMSKPYLSPSWYTAPPLERLAEDVIFPFDIIADKLEINWFNWMEKYQFAIDVLTWWFISKWPDLIKPKRHVLNYARAEGDANAEEEKEEEVVEIYGNVIIITITINCQPIEARWQDRQIYR